MTTNELVKFINKKTGLDEEKTKIALDNLQKIITEELNAGREVQIPGFGNFILVNYPSRTLTHPKDKTQKIVTFPANVPKFHPHPDFSGAIKQAHATPGFNGLEQNNIKYEDLSKYVVPKKILALIPEHWARQYQIVPIKEEENKLIVGMIDPEDREAIEFIKKKTGKELELRICTQADLNHILDQYAGMSGELKKIVESVEIEEGDTEKSKDKNPKVIKEEITESAPAAKIVQSLIKRAVREKASDIHIEPTEEQVIVRFRIDGVLHKVITLPIEILSSIVSRIKILSGMKIDETRLPQDGRFQTVIDQNEIDFRVSTFPTVNGEKIVSRILDKSSGILTLEQLGFRGSAFTILNDNIIKSHGMILVTGPTGSGKTTTLYAVLQKLMKESVNIVTMEDPVEYRMPTINQGQVHSSIGFTFASGLRSILRQDPDVIMIGEIRDHETADIAIHSALTGHIVLSTLHTNDAAGAIPRFIDMQIEPFLINSSLNAVIGQRLCRKICENCREPFTPDAASLNYAKDELSKLPKTEQTDKKIEFFHGKGCSNCHDSGYSGRVGIFEVFNFTNDLKEISAKKGSGVEMAKKAIENGMVTMRQDGVLKALDGITTLEEIWRVTKE